MDFESIILTQISQTEKDKNHMISFMQDIKPKATNEPIKQTHRRRQHYDSYWRGRALG